MVGSGRGRELGRKKGEKKKKKGGGDHNVSFFGMNFCGIILNFLFINMSVCPIKFVFVCETHILPRLLLCLDYFLSRVFF